MPVCFKFFASADGFVALAGWGWFQPTYQFYLEQYYNSTVEIAPSYNLTAAWFQLLSSRSSKGVLNEGASSACARNYAGILDCDCGCVNSSQGLAIGPLSRGRALSPQLLVRCCVLRSWSLVLAFCVTGFYFTTAKMLAHFAALLGDASGIVYYQAEGQFAVFTRLFTCNLCDAIVNRYITITGHYFSGSDCGSIHKAVLEHNHGRVQRWVRERHSVHAVPSSLLQHVPVEHVTVGD